MEIPLILAPILIIACWIAEHFLHIKLEEDKLGEFMTFMLHGLSIAVLGILMPIAILYHMPWHSYGIPTTITTGVVVISFLRFLYPDQSAKVWMSPGRES